MKFIAFTMFDVAKTAEVAQAADKVANTPGLKMLGQYVCQGIPFAGIPPHTTVVIQVVEVESNEAIAAVQYPMGLVEASVWSVPILEFAAGGAATEEKKYRK